MSLLNSQISRIGRAKQSSSASSLAWSTHKKTSWSSVPHVLTGPCNSSLLFGNSTLQPLYHQCNMPNLCHGSVISSVWWCAEYTALSDHECSQGVRKKPQFKGKECCPVSGRIAIDWKVPLKLFFFLNGTSNVMFPEMQYQAQLSDISWCLPMLMLMKAHKNDPNNGSISWFSSFFKQGTIFLYYIFHHLLINP